MKNWPERARRLAEAHLKSMQTTDMLLTSIELAFFLPDSKERILQIINEHKEYTEKQTAQIVQIIEDMKETGE